VTGVPKTAIELAKHFEGFERKVKRGAEITAIAYVCPAGFWTIGYGHLCDPKHSPITEAEAEVYLARDLQSALAATLRFCPVLATEPESRLAAIVDFTFNLGVGRLQTQGSCGAGSMAVGKYCRGLSLAERPRLLGCFSTFNPKSV
jgi:lysozyme